MTTLEAIDYAWIIDWIKNSPSHKNTLEQSGFSKSQLQAGIQSIETYSVSSYTAVPATTLRSAIDNAMGITPTTAQNLAMWYAWSAWKAKDNQ